MEGFKEFAEKLKEIEDDKMQKIRFCKDHNFGHEVMYLEKQVNILYEIRIKAEMISEGIFKPSDINFREL
jgi:hypothetical protein